ncbi:MAG: hypothetical protein L0Y54_13505, partial [Sporichthyaceae bacterium]|nr:hypothetical protein [Sporichthyaceae bacterium]
HGRAADHRPASPPTTACQIPERITPERGGQPTMPDPSEAPRYPQLSYAVPDPTSPQGNVFHIIGAVARLLREHLDAQAAHEFTTAAATCRSYQQVLDLVAATLTITVTETDSHHD